ncbi:hypothetical protein Tco_0119966 [Tanacetum coccineum]
MYIRGRKKADVEPAPPTRDPCDCNSRSKNSSSSNHGRTRRQKRQKLNPTSRMRNQWTSILLAEENIGKVHRDDFIDWLSTVERVFDVWDIPDKLKVKPVAIKLRQHASL